MSKVTDTVLALAKPAAEAAGCEVWDVEYVKEAGAWYLRVYIDKAGGSIEIADNTPQGTIFSVFIPNGRQHDPTT